MTAAYAVAVAVDLAAAAAEAADTEPEPEYLDTIVGSCRLVEICMYPAVAGS